MRPISETVIAAADITTSPTSQIIDAMSVLQISLQAIVSGTSPVGTVKIQFSNDPGFTLQNFTPTHWSDVTNATVAVNATGTFAINMLEVCARWIRIIYTHTSGSGAITVNVKTSGV